PAVLVHGPRQCGKTTLARTVGDAADFSYLSFDDDVLRASAQTDPMGFVADLPGQAILDEIQRVPELFTALKAAIDRDRRPGRFILTGSANVLLLPKLADSLAGRMESCACIRSRKRSWQAGRRIFSICCSLRVSRASPRPAWRRS